MTEKENEGILDNRIIREGKIGNRRRRGRRRSKEIRRGKSRFYEGGNKKGGKLNEGKEERRQRGKK